MRKTFAVLALLAVPALVAAQGPPSSRGLQVVPINPVSHVRTAGDTAPAFVIKYFAPAGTPAATGATQVAVEADGNLTFTVNGAAYTGFECPVAGALGGVLDVSDAECNTAGEVVDMINSTPKSFATGYFRAALGAALRSDDISAATTLLADAADTEVGTPTGEIVYFDSDGLDDEEVIMWDMNIGALNAIGRGGLVPNPNADKVSFVQYVGSKFTNAGTLTSLTCYAVKENYGQGGGCNAAGDCGAGSESVRTIYTEAHGATTVLTSSLAEFPYGFYAVDEKVFCRAALSAADTSVWEMVLSGFTYPAN
jgi:hypothetical protein